MDDLAENLATARRKLQDAIVQCRPQDASPDGPPTLEDHRARHRQTVERLRAAHQRLLEQLGRIADGESDA